jgi:hypothetical protein
MATDMLHHLRNIIVVLLLPASSGAASDDDSRDNLTCAEEWTATLHLVSVEVLPDDTDTDTEDALTVTERRRWAETIEFNPYHTDTMDTIRIDALQAGSIVISRSRP